MGAYVIKPMETEAEIEGAGYVHYKAWQETYPGLIDASFLEGFTEERCKKSAHKWTGETLIAKDGDRVIGFVKYGAYRGGDLPGCGEVSAIYLLSGYQGQKIGYRLMNAAFEKLVGYEKVALWVLKGNDKAIRFYERYGFCFDGTEKEVLLGTPNMEYRMVYEKRP